MIFVDIPVTTATTNTNAKLQTQIKQVKDHLNDKENQLFLLYYLQGCGPCNATRPEWDKLKTAFKSKNNSSRMIAQIDQEYASLLPQIAEPMEFPTILFITNSGSTSEKYQGERNVQALASWIESKSNSNSKSKNIVHRKSKHTFIQGGGKKKKSRKYSKSRKNSKTKKRRKSQ